MTSLTASRVRMPQSWHIHRPAIRRARVVSAVLDGEVFVVRGQDLVARTGADWTQVLEITVPSQVELDALQAYCDRL